MNKTQAMLEHQQLEQPQNDEYWMRRCLKLAQVAAKEAEVPVGALVIKENQVISEGYNRRESLKRPTAHAEIIAIEAAAVKLGSWRLAGCSLYTTLEPCLMCAGAIQQSRIDRVIFGARDPKAGAVVSLYQTLTDNRLNHRCLIQEGILANECGTVLSDFFRERRS